MSIGPLDSDAVESYREAGAILVETMTDAREMIEPGVTQLEVAEYAQDASREAAAPSYGTSGTCCMASSKRAAVAGSGSNPTPTLARRTRNFVETMSDAN
jgi:methionine aminopeptidase